jgi:CHC2 zinc finger
VAGIMIDPAFETWFAQARAVPLAQLIQQRNIKLKRQGVELIGPCPKCGGEDRFGVNLREQLYNCRKCGAKGHGGIDFVAWLDGIEPIPAAEYLNGEPPPKANSKDRAARIYLTSPAAEEGEQPDTDLRELRFKKNNYGPVSESIVLRYRNGLFLPEGEYL